MSNILIITTKYFGSNIFNISLLQNNYYEYKFEWYD